MKKIMICGLGAVGLTYAVKIKNLCELKILVDSKRLKKLQREKPIFNGKEQDFDYILPNQDFTPDLIIISTKSQHLESVLPNLKNFIKENTYIISLINGISSEDAIQTFYPDAKIEKSYFIGHSAVRIGNSVTQDGVGSIVIGNNSDIIGIFDELKLNYHVANNIEYAMWQKYVLNLFSNQTSAILNLTFGELKRNKKFIEFAKKIVSEVKIIAEKSGITNLEQLESDALAALESMCDEGKTSMLQDILAKRPTEVDIFAGEIIRLGKLLHINTPYNQVLYDLIKIKEEDNEHSLYSC